MQYCSATIFLWHQLNYIHSKVVQTQYFVSIADSKRDSKLVNLHIQNLSYVNQQYYIR